MGLGHKDITLLAFVRRFDLDLCKHHTWELRGMPGLGMALVVLDRIPPVEDASSTGSVLPKV